MKVAVEGCMHGELTKMYETSAEIDRRDGYKIDLVSSTGRKLKNILFKV